MMITQITRVLLLAGLLTTSPAYAQSSSSNIDDDLKLAAVEALITAPDDRALPLVKKVLAGNNSDEIKEAALFVLSQIDVPEAQSTILTYAREADGELQLEAIRMIGIGGGENLSQLRSIYDGGDRDTREAVLEALMIADEKQAVFEIAKTAEGDDYEEAVEMLAVMEARDELRQLRTTRGSSEALIEACAISGDFDCLKEFAEDDSNSELQIEAIEAMGIVDADEANAALMAIYKSADNEDIREAALDGLMISDHDAGILELYRASTDNVEKKQLLEYLVIMDSEEVWAVIDAALEGND